MRALSKKPMDRESDVEGGVMKGVRDVTNQKDLMKDTYNSFVPKQIRESIAKASNKSPPSSAETTIGVGTAEMDEFAIFTAPKLDRRGLLTQDFVAQAFQNMKEASTSDAEQEDIDLVPDDNMSFSDSSRR